jgi:hypothetical protein
MFADQVAHDHRAGGDANADMKVDTDVGLNGGHGPDYRQSRARRLLGITFMRMRVTEISQHAVSHVAGDDSPVECDDLLDAGVVGPYHPPQVLGIEPDCEFRRADQIAAQDRQLPPLGIRPRHRLGGPRLKLCGNGPLHAGDRAQHLATMSEEDAEILEILLRQIRNDREVNGILGKALGVLTQSKRSQPLRNTGHAEPVVCGCNSSTNMRGEDISPAVPSGGQRRANRRNSRLQECTHPASSLGAMRPLTATIRCYARMS